MKQFAKLFQNEEFGQILIVRGKDLTGLPAIIIKFTANNIDGVCDTYLSFPDTSEKSYEQRDSEFFKIDEKEAALFVIGIIKQLQSIPPPTTERVIH